MPTTIVQGDMDSLFTELQNSSTGPYNIKGTDVGEFAAGTLSSNFEKNVATLIGVVEFLVANTVSPATSPNAARRQRKMLKELLANTTASIKSVASSSSDDRLSHAANVVSVAISKWNSDNRPEASNSNTL